MLVETWQYAQQNENESNQTTNLPINNLCEKTISLGYEMTEKNNTYAPKIFNHKQFARTSFIF